MSVLARGPKEEAADLGEDMGGSAIWILVCSSTPLHDGTGRASGTQD